MNTRDKKIAILHRLSQESEPIGLSALIEKLGSDYSDRSVRRWLSEMTTEGVIEKIGHKKATKYRALKPSSFKTSKVTTCFGLKSIKIIEQVVRFMKEGPLPMLIIGWKPISQI